MNPYDTLAVSLRAKVINPSFIYWNSFFQKFIWVCVNYGQIGLSNQLPDALSPNSVCKIFSIVPIAKIHFSATDHTVVICLLSTMSWTKLIFSVITTVFDRLVPGGCLHDSLPH